VLFLSQIGFCYILAMFFSNYALFYVNYPTQVIVKSCKMIPVMASSVLIHGKRYPPAAYFRVVMVTIGIIMFTFFKKASKVKEGAQTQLIGLALAFLSLTMDGFVSPNQEALFSKYKTSTHQVQAQMF
jgi:solute carrier family 35 (UDP-galactose transporter), member B1